MERHLEALGSRNYSEITIRGIGQQVRSFLHLAKLSEETPLVEIRTLHAERALESLWRKYKPQTAWHTASTWARIFRWFASEGYLLESPLGGVRWPRRPRTPPLAVLTRSEVADLLEAPDLTTPHGIRDRAILEVFYSSAVRLSELAALEIPDIDLGRGTLRILKAKGGKARVVPLGEKAVSWLRRYLMEVRPRWARNTEALWLGRRKEPVAANSIQSAVRQWAREAGIQKPVTPHTLRRTCATHLVASGASPWAVKELLGHSDLKTLSRYVSLDFEELRKTHEKTHPGAF